MDVQTKRERMLLDYANSNYPLNSEYYDVGTKTKRKVKGVLKYYKYQHSKEELITDGHGGAVFNRDKWAEKVNNVQTLEEVLEDLDKRILIMEERSHQHG